MKPNKILVIGNGFVGKPLAIALDAEMCNLRMHEFTRDDLELFDIVINTAAKTSIDWCENNKEETFETNVTQPLRIAKLLRADQKYVFFSSGCIFKSETESDINFEDSAPQPQCYYTETKLEAEKQLNALLWPNNPNPSLLIIRPRLLISETSHPRNTIDKLLKYESIITTQESATILEDLIVKIKELIAYNENGAFNIANSGTISPSRIAEIFDHPHKKITKAELDALTQGKARRVSTILGTTRTSLLPNIEQRLLAIRKTWHMASLTD